MPWMFWVTPNAKASKIMIFRYSGIEKHRNNIILCSENTTCNENSNPRILIP